MASTYTPIASTVLSSPAASVTFSSISGAYTDLIVRISARASNAAFVNGIKMEFNSDSAGNYSETYAYAASGGGAASSGVSGNVWIGTASPSIPIPAASATANTFSSTIITIPNYSGSTYKKPVYTMSIAESNGTSDPALAFDAGLWQGTAAITRIDFAVASGANNFITGSRFDLYGVTHF